MDLKEHYNKLYQESKNQIANNNYGIDELIDSETDFRRGLTLVIRPSEEVAFRIQQVLREFQKVEPEQYYYPTSDLHITLMAIVSCYEGFQLTQIAVEDYIKLVKDCLAGMKPFQMKFKGLTASPSCVLVQGFGQVEELNNLRDRLRTVFKSSNLEQTLDKRYTIQTAHSTILRLRKKLNQKQAYLDLIEKYREFDFGTFEVDKIELVYNDWYQREKHKKLLHTFHLK